MAAFRSVDLSKNFYFSYSYDLTNTLQSYFIHANSYSASISAFPRPSATAANENSESNFTTANRRRVAWGFHDKFFWNHYLLLSAFGDSIDRPGGSPWVLPLIYGFVDQSKLNVFGRTVHVAVIARRSRHFAGARFLKRGVSENGYVANEVEIEQIVTDALTTALHIPDPNSPEDFDARKPNPRYTSYVQLRGSIPLLWNQDSAITKAKPPMEFSIIDPYFSGAAMHFDDLLARYGPPVIVLNLIKEKERQPRESKLLPEFRQCVAYLNQFLPDPQMLEYVGFDMSAAQRSRQLDVISYLGGVAEEVIEKTKFFHSGPEPRSKLFVSEELLFNDDGEPDESGETQKAVFRPAPLLQCGVCRTNCIDCIDRTNAAQFVVGKAALAHQLHSLGLTKARVAPYDSDAVDILTNMYHDLGDTIALQYGGSHLVNTLQTYRKTGNQYKSHARDTLEGLKRFYANSFADADKQASINLFLGIVDSMSSPILSPLSAASCASTLHLTIGATKAISTENPTGPSPLSCSKEILPKKRSYVEWFNPIHLSKAPNDPDEVQKLLDDVAAKRGNDDYYIRYYRPWLWTSTENHLGRKMNSSDMFAPKGVIYISEKAKEASLTPFKRRRGANEMMERFQRHSAERTPHGVGVSVGVRRWLKTKSNSTLKSSSTAHKGPERFWAHETRVHNLCNEVVGETSSGFHYDEEYASSAGQQFANESERVVHKFLHPTIEPDEAREYHSYVHQFDELRLHSGPVRAEVYDVDLRLYEKTINLSSGSRLDHQFPPIKVDERNRLLYEEAVHFSTCNPLD